MSAAASSTQALFQWLRWRQLCNATRVVLRRSALRPLSILVCSLLVWSFVFFVSRTGFHGLAEQHSGSVPLSGAIVGTLFDLLFLAMLVMLTFSSGIILYSSLFSSPEAAFLLSTPARADRVFVYKVQGAIAFSSWAFVLLGSPILIAYGLANPAKFPGPEPPPAPAAVGSEPEPPPVAMTVPARGPGPTSLHFPMPTDRGVRTPWYFYALLPFFFLAFVLVPGSLGALACLGVVNILPRQRKQVLRVALVLVAAAIALILYRTSLLASKTDNWDRRLLDRMVGQVAVAQGALVPSHWLARGVCAAVRRDLTGALYNLGLLASTGLALYAFAAWAAARLYRRGYNRLATGGEAHRRHGGAWLDAIFQTTLVFFDRQTRLLIVKDFRTFRRDPAQWAQVVIFCGLIALYFTNLRRFIVTDEKSFQNGLSLLNLCSVALLLCTYTGRFIYPMLSLEGRCFWILGLLPLQRSRLLWGKFAFSATGSLFIAETLILLSDLMLQLPPVAVGIHLLTVAVLALGLSGLSVGIGACLPNFKETDPSKIAVGFGGTLNLVAGLAYLLLVIALMAAPWHLQAAATLEEQEMNGSLMAALVVGGVLLGVLIGVAAMVIPLMAGARSLRSMEF